MKKKIEYKPLIRALHQATFEIFKGQIKIKPHILRVRWVKSAEGLDVEVADFEFELRKPVSVKIIDGELKREDKVISYQVHDMNITHHGEILTTSVKIDTEYNGKDILGLVQRANYLWNEYLHEQDIKEEENGKGSDTTVKQGG